MQPISDYFRLPGFQDSHQNDDDHQQGRGFIGDAKILLRPRVGVRRKITAPAAHHQVNDDETGDAKKLQV